MELRHQHVLLTGASRGIGESLADDLAARGARLTLVARSVESLETVAERTGAVAIAGDLTDENFLNDLVSKIGPVDVLVNNAGVALYGPFAEQSSEQISTVIALNFEVPLQLCRVVLPAMLAEGKGHIVNVSSVAMAVTTPGIATYGATKSALSAFSESLRVELEDSGVGLTTVEIGEADTEMLRTLRENPDIDAIFARSEKIHMQRLLDTGEVSSAIVDAIENNKRFVRLPRRSAGLPAWVNGPRALSNLMNRYL